jgi:hypothetical protein
MQYKISLLKKIAEQKFKIKNTRKTDIAGLKEIVVFFLRKIHFTEGVK